MYLAFIVSADGHAISRIDLHSETDDEAKERARQLVTDNAVELWDGPICIARFTPKK